MTWSVQQHDFADEVSNPQPVTLTNPVTAGNLVVVFAGCFGSNTPPDFGIAITDDKSNSYGNPIVSGNFANSYPIGIWAIENVTNGPSTFTMTGPSNSFPMIHVTEFNVDHPAGVAVDVSGENNFSGSTSVTGSVSTAANGDLIYGAFASAGGPIVAGAGFTQIDSFSGFWLTEWQTQAAAGSIAVTATQSSSANCTVLMVAFSPGGGIAFRKSLSPIGTATGRRQVHNRWRKSDRSGLLMRQPPLILPEAA